MSSGWFLVVNRHSGETRYARVSREQHHSDDAYSRWTTPLEYEIAVAPGADTHTLNTSLFHLNYKRVSKGE